MTTRKIVRNGMRREAELKGYTPSKYVHAIFEAFQQKRLGFKQRSINEAIGTHKKKNWRERIRMALAD